ncbi:ABC transporter ATP-binding protein [Halorarum salinum]|uniref:ABC transporter ATP-binding protein n=1 Tax=Halorarum salinum TaxID=2743089 RepID=A0A7D5QEY7_9EURY|nr:ABC transporter ATP-binding protein [Halobaculum salinum]QLG61042.1 ABC transporter ATP-binding protein [Halobaculum salinum]
MFGSQLRGSSKMSSTEVQSRNLFEVQDLRKWFASQGEGSILSTLFSEPDYLKAVDDVDFTIERGEIVGLAGQSGCGKSTLGELLVGLQKPTGGRILFDGEELTEFGKAEMNEFRRKAQVIFQDPYEAMNPRFPVARIVSEPLKIHGIGDRESRTDRTIETLEEVGLAPPEKYLDKLPGELSGGERQRVCIARAIILDPDFLVADEPVSMLDVSVRTGILHLFERLQAERDLSILYISHDLSTINYLADRTMIMYLGNIVESGPTDEVIHEPAHPYTEALLESVPNPNPDATRSWGKLEGQVPSPTNIPTGCRFHPRCAYATEECKESEPALISRGESDRDVACYHPLEQS